MEQAVELGIAPVVFLLKAYRFVQSTYLASYQEPGYELCTYHVRSLIFFSHLNTDDWTLPLGAYSSVVKHRSETNL